MQDFAESIKGMIILELSERLKLSYLTLRIEKEGVMVQGQIKADSYHSEHWEYSVYPYAHGYIDIIGTVPYEDIDCVFLNYTRYLEYLKNSI